MKNPPRLQLNMTLDKTLDEKLDDYYSKTGVPKSTVVKRLLAAFLDGKLKLNDLPAAK